MTLGTMHAPAGRRELKVGATLRLRCTVTSLPTRSSGPPRALVWASCGWCGNRAVPYFRRFC